MRIVLAALATLALASPALAQGGNEFRFTLGGGVQAVPAYPGSDEYEARPSGVFRFQSLSAGGIAIGNPDFDAVASGVSVSGAFNYEGEREASDGARLAGTDDRDASLELGLGVGYAAPAYRVFGEVRYGVTGHDALVGELGADVIARPSERMTLLAGPRATFASGAYNDYYFGVSAAEAGAAAAAGNGAIGGAYEPGGGLVSAGVELTARYQINDDWGVEGSVTYDRLQDDAADSPLVENRDQYGVALNVTRRFTLDF